MEPRQCYFRLTKAPASIGADIGSGLAVAFSDDLRWSFLRRNRQHPSRLFHRGLRWKVIVAEGMSIHRFGNDDASETVVAKI